MKKYKLIFSPTGGTARVADAITEKWNDLETIDLSDQNFPADLCLEADSLALIAMPSFGGLAPQIALDRLAGIQANQVKCVIVAVYGNRAFEDTLVQMQDYAEKAGFQVIAALSAIAEHSIIHEYAAGRPDAKDRAVLCSFGTDILEKAAGMKGGIQVPGNRPYKTAGGGMVPKASAACISCGACAKGCPVSAIDAANPKLTDRQKCIGCMRCVSICPKQARSVNPVMTKVAAMAIKKACAEPKQIEIFM